MCYPTKIVKNTVFTYKLCSKKIVIKLLEFCMCLKYFILKTRSVLKVKKKTMIISNIQYFSSICHVFKNTKDNTSTK